MINYVRKHARILTIIFSFFTIVSLVFLFTIKPKSSPGDSDLATVGGRRISRDEFLRVAGEIRFFIMLRTGDARLSGLDELIKQETWKAIVLEAEARRIGVGVTPEEVSEAIFNLPLADIRTDGKFDYKKYEHFTKITLVANGIGENGLENIVRRQLLQEKMYRFVGATFKTTAWETRQTFQQIFEKATVQFVRFEVEKFKAKAGPVPEDRIQQYYRENTATLVTPEKRQVEFVRFERPAPGSPQTVVDPEEIETAIRQNLSQLVDEKGKPLPEVNARKIVREKLETLKARRVASDAAANFSVLFISKDENTPPPPFAQTAAAHNLKVIRGPLLTRDTDPQLVPAGEDFIKAAFGLRPGMPVSDAIEGPDACYVLHLVETEPSRPKTLEEARAEIRELLLAQAAFSLMEETARTARTRISELMASGKSFEQAAQGLGLKVESLPVLSQADQMDARTAPNLFETEIRKQTEFLPVGKITPFVTAGPGGFIASVKSRELPVSARFEKDGQAFAAMYRVSRQNTLFHEWIATLVQQARTP